MIAVNEVWLKTYIRQEGNFLVATTHMAVAGEPVMFEVKLNLAKLEQALLNYHRRLHANTEAGQISGCVGCDIEIGGLGSWIKKAAKKTGISKIAKTIGKTANGIVRSKITGGIIAAAAVVFPPVGVPAAGAYAAANTALMLMDKANAVRKTASKLVKGDIKGAVLQHLPPEVQSAAAKALRDGQAVKKKILTLQKVATTAGVPPLKRLEAQRTLNILQIAAKARAAQKRIPTSVRPNQRLIVNRRGVIAKAARHFQVPPVKVSGTCIGCINPYPNLH